MLEVALLGVKKGVSWMFPGVRERGPCEKGREFMRRAEERMGEEGKRRGWWRDGVKPRGHHGGMLMAQEEGEAVKNTPASIRPPWGVIREHKHAGFPFVLRNPHPNALSRGRPGGRMKRPFQGAPRNHVTALLTRRRGPI
jgi:hypothetical protein